ncbi:hypothetical protein OQA88_8538 [Cercophora sp. LCS_1]
MATTVSSPAFDQDLNRCCLCWLPLCGYSFQPPPKTAVDWRAEIRSLRSRRHHEEPFLTGVGYLQHRELIASEDTDVHYSALPEGNNRPTHGKGHVYPEDSPLPYWSYQMHDFCWQMLYDRVTDEERPNRKLVTQLLFTLLSGMPFTPQGSLLPWSLSKHSTPIRFDHVTGTFRPFIIEETGFMMANPRCVKLDDHELEDTILANHLQLKATATLTEDPFVKLPAELRLLILRYLPSGAVSKLRHASRVIAETSRPTDLPQAFWESRFQGDNEMAFFQPGERDRSWRDLYCAVRDMLSNKSFRRGGIRNRRQIWMTMQPIYECLRTLLDEMWHTKRLFQSRPPPLPSCTGGDFVRAERLTKGSAPSIGGTTRFAALQLHFPRINQKWFLGVSWRKVSSIKYVSGLRLLEAPDAATTAEFARETSRAGWISPETESTYQIDICPDCLIGMDVASAVNGIVGLALVGKSACGRGRECPRHVVLVDNGTSTKLGSHTTGIGAANLLARNNGSIRGICIEVDACKITAIQILEERADASKPENIAAEPDSNIANGSGDLDETGQIAHIWNPCMPEETGTIRFPISTGIRTSPPSPDMCSDYFLNIAFGGKDGSRLSHLKRIVVYMDGTKDPAIYGMGFYYDDTAEEAFFGTRISLQNHNRGRPPRLAQISAAINGPAGERIDMCIATPVCAADNTTRPFGHIRRLWMHTNHGRSFHFNMELNKSREELPLDGVTKHYGLIVPEGEVMTGFLAKASQGGGYFLEMGFQSQEILEMGPFTAPWETSKIYKSLSLPLTETWKMQAFSKSGNSGNEGLVIGIANLSSVRSIHVSSGETRSAPRFSCRRTTRVTGLRFQFWDTEEPLFLGQWFKEVDSISLDRDERITNLSVWHSRNVRHSRATMSLYGKARGFHVITSKGQSLTVRMDNTDKRLRLSFREKPGEELAGIMWSYDHTIDHVQVISRRRREEGETSEAATAAAAGANCMSILVPETGEDDAYDMLSTTIPFAEWTG